MATFPFGEHVRREMPTYVKPWCVHFQHNDFPDDHVCDAEFALIGEAPSRVEDETGIPFVGKSGYDWESWLKESGLRRSQFYIDNCYPYRPPDNKIGAISRDVLGSSTASMLMRLRRCVPSVRVVVPTGNTALRALFNDHKMQITDWRGSILNWEGRKCIPTIHPAATQRQKVLTKLCVADWKRIAEESKSPSIIIPQRKHIIDPSFEQFQDFWTALFRYFESDETQLPPRVLTIDVENDRKSKKLTCIGCSFDPLSSITVSTVRSDFDTDERYNYAQKWLRNLLGLPFPVVYQNGFTDIFKLAVHWPDLRKPLCESYTWDLMEMAHCLDPNDGGDTSEGSQEETDEGVRVGMLDLATLCSLYTKQPFYKYMSSSADWEKRQVYNGLDCCIQREVFDALWWKLNERGLV